MEKNFWNKLVFKKMGGENVYLKTRKFKSDYWYSEINIEFLGLMINDQMIMHVVVVAIRGCLWQLWKSKSRFDVVTNCCLCLEHISALFHFAEIKYEHIFFMWTKCGIMKIVKAAVSTLFLKKEIKNSCR